MFSSRVPWESEQNPLTRLLQKKRAAGARILDLTESNPTAAGLEYPSEAIQAAIGDPRILRYEPAPAGAPEAREAVSHYYAGRGVDIEPSRILLTASTSEAYTYLFKLLCDPGDEVLIPQPSYPLFDYLAGMEAVCVKSYPLRYDGAWHLDFAALQAAITLRAKAIVVVNPNNPTGSFLKRDEWEKIRALGIPIISDEVFSDFAFRSDPSAMTTLIHDGAEMTFAMSGLSKIAGLPQMKLGWIAVSGTRKDEAVARLEWIADTFLSVSTPVQVALPQLLPLSVGIRDQIKARTQRNLAMLREAIGPQSPFRALNVEGGWYATLQVPRTRSEEEWAMHLLREHDVFLQPGYFYDFESEAFLVLSLLTPEETFTEGARRVLAAA